jgi:plastocyanin
MRKSFALLTLGALPAFACGGSSPEPTPAPAATAAAPAGAPAAPAAGATTITGKVSFEGTAPAAEKVKTSADPKCQQMHPQGLEKKTVAVNNGGLAHAFVWLKTGVTGSHPAPAEPAVLDQQGCEYHPHVVAVRTGQTINIKNSDDTLHNIHPRPTVNKEFNIGQARKGMESQRSFDKQEIMIPVGCDVHPWMRSYISVVDHPYFAVTNDDGTYEIKNVPPGDYEVEVVHEKLKNQTQKVNVKAGAPAKADFTFKG